MRRVPVAIAACASLLLVACKAPGSSVSPSSTPIDSAEQTASSSPRNEPTASPSGNAAGGELLEGFALNDVLRVEVNDLAVRVAPYTNQALATGWTFDGTKWNTIGQLRLDAGEYVSVVLGPVMIGDATWYWVLPAEGGQLGHSTVFWDTNGKIDGSSEPGWVAGAVGSDVYVALFKAFEFDRSLTGLPPPLLVSGSGNYVSQSLENHDLFRLEWVYLIDDQVAPCGFTVTLETVADGASVVAVDSSTIGAFEAGSVVLGAAGTPVVGEEHEPFLVRVHSDCEWSLRLDWATQDHYVD